MEKKLVTLILQFLCWLNDFTYRLIGVLARYRNNGVHPKHEIQQYHRFFLKHTRPGDHILDIGCGTGVLASKLAKDNRKITGIDIVCKNIEIAEQRFAHPDITYLCEDATKSKFNSRFDAIVLSNVLEHIEDRPAFLRSIKALAPILLIRVPLLTRDWLAVYKKNCGWEYRLDLTHFTEYTEEAFRKEMEAAGLHIESLEIEFSELYAVVTHKRS